MKKWGVIVVLVLVSACAVLDLVHEFISNETFEYFSSDPRHVVLVTAIALSGGLFAAGLDHLSDRAKRKLRLVAWGSAAALVTCFSCYFTYESLSLSPLITAAAGSVWPIPVMFL